MAKLNAQGLARTDKNLMSCLLADEGRTVVSVDLSAGEPTATTHYSKDKNYYDATFGMVGKKPYYQGGLLKIDDIYFTTASFSPVGAQNMREAFNTTYDGLTFADKWLEDPEFLKTHLKAIRKPHKTLTLGIGYSMGPKKLEISAYKNGFQLSLKQAQIFYQQYWDTFAGVRALGKWLEKYYKTHGHIINDFGYRLVPDANYKCLNYYIQSTVSGIINTLCFKFFQACPYARFITVIHDEVLFDVPDERIGDAKKLMQACVNSLNNELNWDVAIRTGWAPGKDWYTAK